MKALQCLLFLLTVILFSCRENPAGPAMPNDLYGTWVHESYQDSFTVMKKSAGLDSNSYGFIFYSDTKFLERKNIGWCGTPPLVYGNYAGKWKYGSENTIDINVGNWSGETSYKIKIISLTAAELKYMLVLNINE